MATATLRQPTTGALVTYPYNYPFAYNQPFTVYEPTATAGEADTREMPSPSANLRTVAGATANLRQR
jgi:hypothetical protein